MPINIELALECSRSGTYPNLSNPRVEGDDIVVQYTTDEYDVIRFNPVTGVQRGHENSDNPNRLRNKSEEKAITYYRIWFGHKDWTKADWRYLQDDSKYQFDDGKSAAARSKELNKELADAGAPWKFMVKTHTVMSPNHKWREWMQERFATGEYGDVPWKDEPWYIKDHFAHLGIADPFKIAFVESAVAGAEDRMTVLNPGRYLERFYSDHLSAQDIAMWAARADSECELAFAMSPDEIEEIYTSGGIDSCMKYKADSDHFPLGVQPTRIYGAGDLALAHLRRRGKLIARALVWPDRKVVGRVYGDSERMVNALVAEGYAKPTQRSNTFDGAKMLRIEIGGEIVMPYLDWSMTADDAGDHLVIRDAGMGKYRGQTTNGTASGRSIQVCGHNGCRTVIAEGNGFYNAGTGRTICGPCADSTLVRCVASNSLFPTEGRGAVAMLQVMRRDGTPYPGFRGGYIHPDYARTGDYPYRLVDGVAYPATEVERVSGSGRRTVYRVLS